MIKIEDLKARIKDLERARAQHQQTATLAQANVNACNGAIAETNRLISLLEAEQTKPALIDKGSADQEEKPEQE